MQVLFPILKDVKDELGEQIKIIKIDVDKNQSLAQDIRLGVYLRCYYLKKENNVLRMGLMK